MLIRSIAAVFVLLFVYLLAWPVPIDPVAWNPPRDRGLVDPFAVNNQLAAATAIDLGHCSKPEDAAEGSDGYIYVACEDGAIGRFDTENNSFEVFAQAGGRPLGLEFDRLGNLFVANAHLGLQLVTPGGEVRLLTDSVAGNKILFADDVAVAADGIVYFTDASSKFGPTETEDPMAASVLDIMEHAGNGRVLRFDPANGQTSVVMRGLSFANGIAISADENFLLVNETGEYRIWRYWLRGDRAGASDVILDNLPGFPDNINNGLQGRFWVGLVSPRNPLLDDLGPRPFLRKVIMRLPDFMVPADALTSHVIAIGGDGEVLMSLQDPAGGFPLLTGVLETSDSLYLTNLFDNRFGRLAKTDLFQ